MTQPTAPLELRRVAVQWPRLGPYHLARLRGAHAVCAAQGVEIVAVETVAVDDLYAWREERAPEPFTRVQLFDRPPEAPAAVVRAMWRTLDALQPQAVAINSYGQTDALAALGWCRARGRAAVMMNESKADDAVRHRWREALKGTLVRLFDAALLGGAPQTRYYEQLGLPPSRLFTGYDVVDHHFFAEQAARARLQPRPAPLPAEPYFLASNRFLRRKNVDGLLRAYGQYRARADHPWPLVLLGDGPERQMLDELARGMPDVHFAGFRQIDELPAYYAHAGAFVHPAHTDQWGLVVNEAAASGLPLLVSTRAGCAEDLVRSGWNGLTFAPTDDAIADALCSAAALPENERQAWGRRSFERSAEAFTPHHFGEGLFQAVQAALPHAYTRGAASRLAGYALAGAARHVRVRRLHTTGEA